MKFEKRTPIIFSMSLIFIPATVLLRCESMKKSLATDLEQLQTQIMHFYHIVNTSIVSCRGTHFAYNSLSNAAVVARYITASLHNSERPYLHLSLTGDYNLIIICTTVYSLRLQ